MKANKAINILGKLSRLRGTWSLQDKQKACKLGMEGLKAIQDYRKGLVVDFMLPLPGETLK